MLYVQGDGGHAKVVRELIDATERFFNLEFAIVAIGNNMVRKREVEKLSGKYIFPTVLVHPTAFVSPSATLGVGTVVMPHAVVHSYARVGNHVIVNTGSTVDHDCVVEDFAHIAPGVHLCGGVFVGEGALVGVGSCAVPLAKIPAWSEVRAGSMVNGTWDQIRIK